MRTGEPTKPTAAAVPKMHAPASPEHAAVLGTPGNAGAIVVEGEEHPATASSKLSATPLNMHSHYSPQETNRPLPVAPQAPAKAKPIAMERNRQDARSASGEMVEWRRS